MPNITTVTVSVRFTPNDINKKARTAAYAPAITDAPRITERKSLGSSITSVVQVDDVTNAPVIREGKKRIREQPLLLSAGVIKSQTMILAFNHDGSMPTVSQAVDSVYGVAPQFFPSMAELHANLKEIFNAKADCKVAGGISIEVRDSVTGTHSKPRQDFRINFHEQLNAVINALTLPVPMTMVKVSLGLNKSLSPDPKRKILGGGSSKMIMMTYYIPEDGKTFGAHMKQGFMPSLLDLADKLEEYAADHSYQLSSTRHRSNAIEITSLADSLDRRSKIATEVYPIASFDDIDAIVTRLRHRGGLEDTVILEQEATVILERAPISTSTSTPNLRRM